MTQQTSWEGVKTKALQKKLKDRFGTGFYTRYSDRRNRSGLQVVRNGKYANYVFTTSGTLVRIEPKYNNYSGNDPSAERTYKNEIRKEIQAMIRRNKSLKSKIDEHR